MTALLWFALLAALGICLLAVPLVPAWREWSRPTDASPLAVHPRYAAQADYFAAHLRRDLAGGNSSAPALAPSDWSTAREPIFVRSSVAVDARVAASTALVIEGDLDARMGGTFSAVLASGNISLGAGSEITQWVHADRGLRLGAGSVALRRASCTETLEIARGCSFERLHAPLIVFGAPRTSARRRASVGASAQPAEIANAVRRAPGVYRVEGDCAIPDDTRLEGSLIVTGSLVVGAGAAITGDIKAREGIIVGPGATIDGAATCEGVIHVRERAFVKGPVVAEKDVWIDAGAEVGSPAFPTTVTAENIIVADGVAAHGTVHARDAGIVWSPA